ncbi:response regulator transcription factor [Alloiococcus sp. CFN-8]|uniref:response regulator transcription factor n=1 Tax=Alloiococcus sp. CFN-8 TaxID=3416081 RepID=UPI003CF7F6EA
MKKVMIIEDERLVRHGVIKTIDWEELGCTIIGEAEDGEQGLDLIRELSPDLIITDIKMPKLDGVSMLKKLREEAIDTPVILLSAYNDFKYAQAALRLKASDYILKPVKEEELKEAIRKLFHQEETAELVNPPGLDFYPNKNISNKYVLQAIKYIKFHYKEDISISTVAAFLEISDGHLSRAFKKETSYTFTSYLTYYRIQMACILLKDCRVKVYEIAAKVGYSDTAYFSTLFKKLMGVSPSEYNLITNKHE